MALDFKDATDFPAAVAVAGSDRTGTPNPLQGERERGERGRRRQGQAVASSGRR